MKIDERALQAAAAKLGAKPEWIKQIIEAYEEAKESEQPVGLTTLPKQLAQDIYAELFDEASANYGPEVSKQERIGKITNRILKHVLHFWPSATVRESGWRPSERQELAEECARYFAGYSFSRHEVAQCLGLIDVLIRKNLIARPSKNTQIEGGQS